MLLGAREVLLEFHVDISNSSILCVTRTAGTAFVILLDRLLLAMWVVLNTDWRRGIFKTLNCSMGCVSEMKQQR